MSAETILPAALGALVSDRIYPDVAPEGSPLPRIVYQQVGGVSTVYAEGALPTTENGRYQLACWAETRLQALALAQQVEEILVAHPVLQAEPIGARTAAHEPDNGLRGYRQDFSIWSPR